MENKIREIRKQHNMTMKQLGIKIGVAESTISQYENGKRQPDNETLLKIGELFNVTVGYLLGVEEMKKPTAQVGGELSERDSKLLARFRSLPPEKQKAILSLGDGPEDAADPQDC